ncbi:hypothetical protein V1291_004849 [Nitrobacteraceae bacterium AZCC 1564]
MMRLLTTRQLLTRPWVSERGSRQRLTGGFSPIRSVVIVLEIATLSQCVLAMSWLLPNGPARLIQDLMQTARSMIGVAATAIGSAYTGLKGIVG